MRVFMERPRVKAKRGIVSRATIELNQSCLVPLSLRSFVKTMPALLPTCLPACLPACRSLDRSNALPEAIVRALFRFPI